MEMSAACTAPVQPEITPRDMDHPMYNEYMRYRDAMNAQLVSCLSFTAWLHQRAQAAESHWLDKHPRVGGYRKYLRAFYEKNGTHVGAISFSEYLLSL